MKKIFGLLVLALSFGFAACDDPSDKDIDAGGTAVKNMSGDWFVNLYMTDETDSTQLATAEWEDQGTFTIYAYNTAANKSTEMWLDDKDGELDFGQVSYSFKSVVNVNYGRKTFGGSGLENVYDDSAPVTVFDGKVLQGAGTRESGVKADSIVFYLKVGDAPYGWFKIAGLRRP